MNISVSPLRDQSTALQHDALLSMNHDELISMVEQLGIDWAAADEEANLLEETKKTLLAKFTIQEQKAGSATGGKGIAMNLAETRAMADPQYEEHVMNMVKKRGEANRLKVKYDSGRVKIELLRSLLANARAAMQLSGSRT